MTHDDDILRRLSDANPVDESALPDHESPQARAMYERIVSGDHWERRRVPRWAVAVAGAGAAATAVAAAVVILTSGSSLPESPDREPPGTAVMCVEAYDLATLANREIAFAGTVTAIDGDRLTFAVERWFRGGDADTVTLGGGEVLAPGTTTSSTSISVGPAGGEQLAVGDAVLVSGDGGFAWACGFTRFRSQAEEAQWAEVFGG